MQLGRRTLGAAAVATLVAVSAVTGVTSAASTPGPLAVPGIDANAVRSNWNALSTPNQGLPAPQPLPHLVSVTIGAGAAPLVDFLTGLLANYFGEFAAENLKVSIVFQPATNEIVLLQSGRVKMAAMGLAAGVFNAIQEGADLHMVLQGGIPGSADQEGMWVRNGLLSKSGSFDPCQLKQGHYNVDIGPDNNIGIVPFALLVEKCPGATLGEVKSHITFSPLVGSDVIAALESKSLDLAYLTDPFTIVPGLAKQATLVQKVPPDYNFGGWMMGAILKTEPTVAEAIMRAMVRTQDEYLQGDYAKSPRVLAAMAKVLSEPQAVLRALPPTVFPDQIATNGITQLQQDYLNYGGLLGFTTPLMPSRLIDPSLLTAVQTQK
jgi:ABC-type nitrate/sulfonate/bicarbonate transport system substrate-binding protein